LFVAAITIGFRAPRVRETGGPVDLGLRAEDLSIPTVRNKRLFAWFIPAAGTAPAPAVVILHGWGANAEMMLPFAPGLHGAGFAVLLIDARNHGRSDGDGVVSSMPKFAEDLSHAVDALRARPDVDPARISVVGYSVGAAAALLCASRRNDIAACVSLAAFAHPENVMRRIMARGHIPYVPIGWLVNRVVEIAIGHRFAEIAPMITITRVRCPVLLGHGTADTSVPVADARTLLACADASTCRLIELPGVDHGANGTMDRVTGPVVTFLSDVVLEGPGAAQARQGPNGPWIP
jgi:pimeloyl-ACP methyl ester carboxylesterase